MRVNSVLVDAGASRKAALADPYALWLEMRRYTGDISGTLEQRKEDLAEFRAALVVATLQLSTIVNTDERFSIIRRLYTETDVPVWALHAALMMNNLPTNAGGVERIHKQFQHRAHEFSRTMGVVGTVPCCTEGCEGRVKILSRTQWRNPGKMWCEACEAAREEANRIYSAERDKERAAHRILDRVEYADMERILAALGIGDDVFLDRLQNHLYMRQQRERWAAQRQADGEGDE